MLTANSIPSLEKNSSQGASEDNVNVMDCKEPIFKVAERTVYNIAGEILFHFKYGEDRAAAFRDLVARLMTPGQLAEAQKLSREWKPTK